MTTGIARAGIDALIELAGAKTPRGRTDMLCENPQVQDAVGRADALLNAGRAYRSAMIAELWIRSRPAARPPVRLMKTASYRPAGESHPSAGPGRCQTGDR